jgi:hypothetical protein
MLWQFACNTDSVLDVNNAFGNNPLQFNPQIQALSSLGSQQTTANAVVNFTDLLASAQAESEQVQDETTSGSVTGQPFQSANSSLNFVLAPQLASSGSSSLYGPASYSSAFYGPTLAGQSQTPNPLASDAQDRQTPSSDSSAEAAVVSEPTSSADSMPTLGPAAAPASAGFNSNSKALGSSQPVPPRAGGAGSESVSPVVISNPQGGEAASAKKSLALAPVVAQLSVTAGGLIRAAANQKALASKATAPEQPVAQATTGSAKSPDKAKARKENPTEEAKNNAGNGIAGAGSEPAVAAAQSDSISSQANPATGADMSAHNSDVAPKILSASKVDASSDLAFALKIHGNDPAAASGNMETSAQTDHPDAAAANAFSSQMTASAGMSEPGMSEPGMSELGMSAPGILEAKAASKTGLSAELPGSGTTGQFNISSLAPSPSAVNSGSNTGENTAPAEEAAPASAIPEDQSAVVQPVKTVQVQISGADDQKVDLKLVEKSGSLTMSVRSSDTALTKSLQQNLPDLTTRLSDQQIRAEWWRPDTQQTDSSGNNSSSGGNGSASQNQSNQNQSNQDQSNQDQGNQNKSSSGQQGGRGTSQPDWLKDLATSNNSNQNGTQFTWHL